ncbi:MAG: photosynthetic reaction center cytochrome c subunit family protein [Bryobacteraceae bacterium]
MKLGSTRFRSNIAAAALTCLLGTTIVSAQTPAPKPAPAKPPAAAAAKPAAAPSGDKQLAEEVFKNVTVLKGLSADDFLGTMGVFSAALGISCEDCHKADDTKWEGLAVDNPMKNRARGMVRMMAALNKQFFGGRQMVTCYTCHRGNESPRVTSSLVRLYGTTPETEPITVIAQAPNAPKADAIFDKFLNALGGAQKVAGLTSIQGKGINGGYGPEGGARPLEFYAKAPGMFSTIVQTDNGPATTTYDGKAGYYAAPLRPVPVLAYTGQFLAGMKLDIGLMFPAQIKTMLTDVKVGFPETIGTKDYRPVQGKIGGALATLYFDEDSGLLVRLMRYADTVVGRIVIQYDYSDYREVNGVKIPHKWVYTWLDGRETFELQQVQTNVNIDNAKFAKPAPVPAKN